MKPSRSMWEYPQSFKKYLRPTLVFMWNNALRQKFNFSFGKSSISVFQKIFASTDKIFILGGGIGNNSMNIWHFPDIFQFTKRQLVRQLVYTSLLLINTVHFTCVERKICSTIKKSENVMNPIVCQILFYFLYLY